MQFNQLSMQYFDRRMVDWRCGTQLLNRPNHGLALNFMLAKQLLQFLLLMLQGRLQHLLRICGLLTVACSNKGQ